MFLEGRRIMTSRTLLAKRRRTLHASFEVETRHILEEQPCSDVDLVAALTVRHTLEPLVILPTSFEHQTFQKVHTGVPGFTESFYAFQRDVPYAGDQSLWSYSSFAECPTDLRMKFSGKGEATIHGVCTEAECRTIDSYLERDLNFLRRHILPLVARHVAAYNGFVADRAAYHVRASADAIGRIRKEVAIA